MVIQVGTGDVLASASYPSYDLSSFSENYAALLNDPTLPMLNRALQGRYAPGSTFKVVTATAGLTEGVITPETTIYDRGIIDEYEGDEGELILDVSGGAVFRSGGSSVPVHHGLYGDPQRTFCV